jgi:hypothetical protein
MLVGVHFTNLSVLEVQTFTFDIPILAFVFNVTFPLIQLHINYHKIRAVIIGFLPVHGEGRIQYVLMFIFVTDWSIIYKHFFLFSKTVPSNIYDYSNLNFTLYDKVWYFIVSINFIKY